MFTFEAKLILNNGNINLKPRLKRSNPQKMWNKMIRAVSLGLDTQTEKGRGTEEGLNGEEQAEFGCCLSLHPKMKWGQSGGNWGDRKERSELSFPEHSPWLSPPLTKQKELQQCRADLEMHELDDVGVSNVHLVQQAADEALHLAQVAQQTLLLLLLLLLLSTLRARGALHIPQQFLSAAALAFLFFCRQADLQKDLHSSTVLGRKATDV